ncbi:hypothetical protein H696_06072 [Fonticula alba]|uniref:Uncharacterized protein n=1 Tax=Fonticula alba TaxID=691883 RepID=A0A058Z0W8_FONAL|nr:hypothetical protein H696_06072 [Fonticula alba]KCV67553.1 hypothetical protein H696_06072 [Fonticula alba]|eukprot:XP_009498114.1 hypothetical protein H696_06072 [Fonticula alba]
MGTMQVDFAFHRLGQGPHGSTMAVVSSVSHCMQCLGIHPSTTTKIRAFARHRWQGDPRPAGITPACTRACQLAGARSCAMLAAHGHRLLVVIVNGCLLLVDWSRPLGAGGPDAPLALLTGTILKRGIRPGATFQMTTTPGEALLVDSATRSGYLVNLAQSTAQPLDLAHIPLPLFEDDVAARSFMNGDVFRFDVPESVPPSSLASPFRNLPAGGPLTVFCNPRKGTATVFREACKPEAYHGPDFENLINPQRLMIHGRRALSLHEDFLVCHEYPFGGGRSKRAAFAFALRLPSPGGRLCPTADAPLDLDHCRVALDGRWAVRVNLLLGQTVDGCASPTS